MLSQRKWLPPWQRREIVEASLDASMSRREAAAHWRVSPSTVQYWIDHYRAATEVEQQDGSWAEDRSSAPRSQPAETSEADHDRVCEVRQRTGWGPRLIAVEVGMAHATVSKCLQRRGLSRRPPVPRGEVRRFEWPCPGDLLQMDTKQFARFSSPGHAVTADRSRTSAERREKVGKQFAHSIIDDHTRLAYTELCDDERAATVTGFVARALRFFAEHAIEPKRLQTDNAWAYTKNRTLTELLANAAIQHRFIPPRTPKRNGKVERYQQTLGREWGLGQTYKNSDARQAALAAWLDHYNHTRNHSSLSNRPPISRVRKHSRHDT